MYHQTYWTLERISQRLQLLASYEYIRREPLPAFKYLELPNASTSPPVEPDVDDTSWDVVEAHTYWGRPMTNFVLRTTFRVPGSWDPAWPVALYLPLGEAGDFSHPEALVYVDGQPYASCDRHHQEIIIPLAWCDGTPHVLALHGWTGLMGLPYGRPYTKLLMGPCAVVQIHPPTRDFLATARVALAATRALPEDHPARTQVLNALGKAFAQVDWRDPGSTAFYESISTAHAALREDLQCAGSPMPVEVIGVGHAHIDVAWLWPVSQTRRKAGRSFHTVIRLMELFPDYTFTQSQPQLYDFVRQDYPELFKAIQARVAEGRWELVGGMWVEADCNISGAEALARQFLLGRRFFREHFGEGAESPVLWLPDTFGYPWSLPQLIKEADLKYFFSIKLSWNQYNRFPYDSFWWQGLDGTKVLTHFSTTPTYPGTDGGPNTYNAQATPEEVMSTWQRFRHKEAQRILLMAFGYGDGGGGPTREMLENVREMAAFPGLPRVRHGTVRDFFEQMEKTSGERLPTWNGELYLELHRGTYTTQSRTKRYNRKSEFALHDAEFLATAAHLIVPSYAYPHETLTEAWRTVCLNQFHDIIPGSSIRQVYEEAESSYEEVLRKAQQVQEEALKALADHWGNADLLVVNPTSFTRQDLAFWAGHLPPGQRLVREDGTPVPVQVTDEGTWLDLGSLPPYSVHRLRFAPGVPPQVPPEVIAEPGRLENRYLRVEFDEAGDIVRIYDKVNDREIVPKGAVANQFQAFDDRPLKWDAWDVDIFYEEIMWTAEPASEMRVVEAGPLRATLEIRRRILHSPYVQRISLAYNSPRLDVDTRIDWQERHVLLKVAFPVEVLSPTATYEIQWGHIERPTHRNTSWDWARFEVVAHKWVDLSEGGYGVSLLNDCKYGHDVQDNVIRLSLLRSPTQPDPEADRGEHHFVYSLLPHAGPLSEHTIAEAYMLNDPIIVYAVNRGAAVDPILKERPDTFGPGRPFIAVDQSNVVVETIKWAEDGEGLIVRLYEARRARGRVTLRTAFPVRAAWRTNLLEENRQPVEAKGREVRFAVRPFEIVTLRLIPDLKGRRA